MPTATRCSVSMNSATMSSAAADRRNEASCDELAYRTIARAPWAIGILWSAAPSTDADAETQKLRQAGDRPRQRRTRLAPFLRLLARDDGAADGGAAEIAEWLRRQAQTLAGAERQRRPLVLEPPRTSEARHCPPI